MPLPAMFRDFRTYITLVSLSIGIVGLYHYYESVQERVPTFFVSPTRSRIVDTSVPAPPQLQVLYKGKGLNANVSAATVYFWNDGRLPIKAEDVLEPLKIELDPGCEIIDTRILKVSRAVTKFAKSDVSDTAANVLPVSFGILERNDGAALQIIYVGSPKARVSIAGTVVGSGPPKEIFSRQERPIDPGSQSKLLMILVASLAAFTGTSVAVGFWQKIKQGVPIPRRSAMISATTVGMNLLLLSVVVYADHQRSLPVVPPTVWMSQ